MVISKRLIWFLALVLLLLNNVLVEYVANADLGAAAVALFFLGPILLYFVGGLSRTLSEDPTYIKVWHKAVLQAWPLSFIFLVLTIFFFRPIFASIMRG